MTNSITPAQVLIQNIETLMRIRNIESHEDLADRMDLIGIGWQRRTVGRILKGERRVNTDEIFALALVLGTTVEQLLKPGLAERIDGEQTPTVWIKVGSLEGVPYPTIAAVVRDPGLDEHPNHEPSIGIDLDRDGYWRIPAQVAIDTIVDGLTRTLTEWNVPIPAGADVATIGEIYQTEMNRRLEQGTVRLDES